MSRTRGISDTTGVMLVAAVAITVSVTVGIGVVEYQRSQSPSAVNAQAGATIEGENLTLIHRGGSAMHASTIQVVARSGNVTKFAGRDASEVVGDGDAYFEPGEEWRWHHVRSFAGNTTVLLVERGGGDAAENVVDVAKLRDPTTAPPTTPTTTPPTTTTTVGNAPPTAAFSVSDATPGTNDPVTFDAAAANDTDGYVAAYAWDLDGDGAFERSGERVTHAYADDGARTVTLRVTDDDGATDTATATVTVGNQAPTASIDVSCSGVSCSFTADASDADGRVTGVDWDFGDGATGHGTSVTHAYETGGTYAVTATVTDDDGATTTVTRSVTVTGEVAFVAGDAAAPGGTGPKTAVRVTLENRRAEAVAVVAVSVSVSKQNVDAVYESNAGSGPFRNEFYVAATEDGGREMGRNRAYWLGDRERLDAASVVASGGRATVTIAEFGSVRTECWGWWCWRSFKPRNVPGARVTLEVWFADGTHRTYEFKA